MPERAATSAATVKLFLGGDVMTGRGIDQILAHPGPPQLNERFVKSALTYVDLAEERNGPIPRHADDRYIWGDGLDELEHRKPDVRIVNLETAVTTHDFPEPKGINYRMSPRNFSCISAAGIDCCVLANNHVLDWGKAGLHETLFVMQHNGIAQAGAGRTAAEAMAPAILPLTAGEGRVLVFAMCTTDCGVPSSWQARDDRPGVNLIPDISSSSAGRIARHIRAARHDGDVVIASIHWGRNWGYRISGHQRAFAHALIDGGADIIHGHSSHHPKVVEIYQGRPIIYGCGDLLNDYEGIGGHEKYRPDLALMYFIAFNASARALVSLELVPMRIRNFRLCRASHDDALWLKTMYETEGSGLNCSVRILESGCLGLDWR